MAKKNKKEKKKHVKVKAGENYKLEGQKAERTKLNCPKCGPGNFMAEHKDRWHCGKCGYTKYKK